MFSNAKSAVVAILGVFFVGAVALVVAANRDVPQRGAEVAIVNAASSKGVETRDHVLPLGSALARLTATTDEMTGATAYFGERLGRLGDLTWGIDVEGHVGVAHLVYEGADGLPVTYASDVIFYKMTRRVEDLIGCLIPTEDDGDLLIRAIEYGIDADGRLVVPYLEFQGRDGTPKVVDNFMGFACCHVGTAFLCIPGQCSSAPTTCAGVMPCVCGGTGDCGVKQVLGCRGGCPGTESTCTGHACSGNVLSCRCN